jgi:hypothetical protein
VIVDGYLAVLIAKKAARAWCWLVLAGVDVLGASSANPPACFAFLQGMFHTETIVALFPQDGHHACS